MSDTRPYQQRPMRPSQGQIHAIACYRVMIIRGREEGEVQPIRDAVEVVNGCQIEGSVEQKNSRDLTGHRRWHLQEQAHERLELP